MGKDSAIGWTDHTFNPWWGCARVSPGCERCYAETFAHRLGLQVWGQQAPRRFFGERHWAEPLKWDRAAEREGVRARVFCASMADVFEAHPDPALDEARTKLWRLIKATPHLDWLLLTKRPQNVERMIPKAWESTGWPRNIWLGVTAEDQRRADLRIPLLSAIQGPAVKFVSYEPALERVTLPRNTSIDWVIIGGESGPGARPFYVEWARHMMNQCRPNGVVVFVKQMGSNPRRDPVFPMVLKHRKGEDWGEWPEELRVREWPWGAS